ncbi:MAG: L,D-transpeptidase family protein [Oscillospiraceae bacterium]|nr:L,D-transpeptidase family protein [Oscillospiraceae bacterium]
MQNQKELEELVNSVTRTAKGKEKKDVQEREIQESASENAKTGTAPEVPISSQQKMAQIREALAMANHDDTPATPRPTQHQELKPLRRAGSTSTQKSRSSTSSVPKPQKSAGKKLPVPSRSDKPGKPKKPGNSEKMGNPLKMADRKKAAIYAGGIGAAVLVTCVLSFFIVAGTYKERFLPNTYVSNVNIAGMTMDEAKYALLMQTQAADLRLTTHKGDTAVFAASDFDAVYTIPEGALDEAAAESPYSWVGKLFNSSEYTIQYDFYYSRNKLRSLIDTYDWGSEVSQDARIVRDDSGDFIIEVETLGDQFDANVLMNYIDEQLGTGRFTLELMDSGCYEPYFAKVKAEDLGTELELYNSYAKCTITFDFDDRKKVVESSMIVDWIMTLPDGTVMKDGEGNIQLDRDAIGTFVAQMAAETDTFGTDRSFYATVDGWITVPWVDTKSWDKNNCSNYGWKINQDATVQQIIDLVHEGKTVTVEPTYYSWGKGYVRATDDIGTTYVEADISEQHFWVYKNNTIVMEGDFVSGTETNWERRTPRGICQVLDLRKGKTLGTMAVQGYETWVDYWMAFNNCGCGFHDLGRSAYGGSIYMYNGSHGCLNLSYSNAKELFSILEYGMPVIVHD